MTGWIQEFAKTNFVHTNAVRKLLVAIILNIMSTIIYSKTIQI